MKKITKSHVCLLLSFVFASARPVMGDDESKLLQDLYDTWTWDSGVSVSFWGHISINDFGEDVRLSVPAVHGSAYAIEELGFHFIPIADTTIETWARVRIWADFDDTHAVAWTESSGCSANWILHDNLLAEVVISFGADDDNECNEYGRYKVNLVTGEFWDDLGQQYVTKPGMRIVSNSSPVGRLPAGYGGDDDLYVTVEYGTDDGSGDFTDGPLDACNDSIGLTGPGGRFVFLQISPEPADPLYPLWGMVDLSQAFPDGDGYTLNGYQIDGKGNNDGSWNCRDGILAENRPDTLWPPVLLLRGTSKWDCNRNGRPDDWDIATGFSEDITCGYGPNGMPDECDDCDCNWNGCWDKCDVDCSSDPRCLTHPDNWACQCDSPMPDCNNDLIPDVCQVAGRDCNGNGVIDECEELTLGDYNADTYVDVSDFYGFVVCFEGVDAPPYPLTAYCASGCLEAFDYDLDGDVDLADFAAFQRAIEIP